MGVPSAAAALVLVAFAPILGGRCLAGSDFGAYFEPLVAAVRDGFARGDLLRTPLHGHGAPLLAHPVAAIAQPLPALLAAALEPARAASLSSLLHLAILAAGAAALARAWGRSPAAAVAAGIVAGLSGAAASSMLQPTLLRGMAWAPWALLALERACAPPHAGPGRRSTVVTSGGLAAATALVLLSAEPFVVLPVLAAMALVLAGVLARRGSLADAARELGPACAGLAAGAIVAGACLWPVLVHLPATVRAAGFTPELVGRWSFHPAQALGLVVPHAFGDPRLAGLDGFAAHALVPGRVEQYFASCYVGALALGLAAAGAVAGRARERAAAAGVAVLVLLALGTHGGLHDALVALGMDWLRYPVKWLAPAMLPLGLLVAAGVDAIGDLARREARRAGVAIALVALVALVPVTVASCAGPLGAWLAQLAPAAAGDAARAQLAADAAVRLGLGGAWSAGCALAAVALVVALAGRARRPGPAARTDGWTSRAGVATCGVAALLAADLGVQARRAVPLAGVDAYRRVPAAAALLRAEPVRQRTWVDVPSLLAHPIERPPRTAAELVAWQRSVLMHLAPVSFGIAVAFPTDVDGLAPLRLHELGELVARSPWPGRLAILGAAGVTHVATLDADAEAGGLAVPVGSVDAGLAAPVRILRNRAALPRVRVVPAVVLHEGRAGLAQALQVRGPGAFGLATFVDGDDWREAHADERPPAEGPQGWTGSARVLAETATRLDVAVSGDGGCLVVSDAFVPGFSATLDGTSVPILPADHAFLGVVVPPGEHVVSLRYRPWSRPVRRALGRAPAGDPG